MDSDVDLTGRRIGRYEIRSLLGRGGMGAVYRAYDSNLDRQVAIKILPPQLVTDAERVRRFMQEAKSASALNHPHVVSIHEIGEDGGMHYIAMELVEGATLRARMGGAPLDLKRAIIIGEEIAEAIGAAHEAGVIHRDLKPENILIATGGYVKVLDFGLAKLRKDSSSRTGETATAVMSTEPGRIVGTVGYMSPEQAEGKPLDHRSDIFSLGCILYEMVAGRSPFRGRSQVETMHNIVHVEPAPLAAPPELQRIVSKALAKAPEERYQSAKDLAVDLRRLLRELDSNTSLTSEYGYTPTRRRRSFTAIALAIAALAVIAIAMLMRTRDEPEAPAPPKTPLTIRRITSTGNAIAAAVSPDGKYIAYVNSEQGQQSLRLRHLATQQELQLVPPAPVGFWGHSFTPDGASIYYVLKTREQPLGALHAISILGGTPQKILDGIDSRVTFSPDGKKIAYVRGPYPAKTESALMEANADGSGARVLAKRTFPAEFFVPIFYTGPAWSPDGKRIAAAVLTKDRGSKFIEVDVTTGADRLISDGWAIAQQLAWLPRGDALIAIASRQGTDGQVWLLPYPSGEPRPVTTDLFDYRMATITADGSAIVTVAADVDADLWQVPMDAQQPPRMLRSGKAVGVAGVSLAPDGSIAWAALDSGNYDIWIGDAGGSSARQLTKSGSDERNPRFTPDGRSVIYSDYGDGATLRRAGVDGGAPAAIAAPTLDMHDVSPDGRTVVFRSPAGLAKVAASGGTVTPLTDYLAIRPAVSPDGTRIACYCQTDAAAPMRLCIIPMSGGAPERTFDAAGPHFMSMLRWTPDGRALILNTMPRDRRNLWLLPLNGGEPKQLTNFNDQMLFGFGVTADGKASVVSRGEMSRDAVMITGF